MSGRKKEKDQDTNEKPEESSPLGFLPGLFGKRGSAVKTAAEEERETVTDAIEKLATVGAIEAVLEHEIESGDEERCKTAEELRRINRGYGVRILFDLCSG